MTINGRNIEFFQRTRVRAFKSFLSLFLVALIIVPQASFAQETAPPTECKDDLENLSHVERNLASAETDSAQVIALPTTPIIVPAETVSRTPEEQAAKKTILGRARELFKENAFGLIPLALIPFAALTGGNVADTTMAAVQLSAGAVVIKHSVEFVIEGARKFVPARYLVPFVAGITNVTQLAMSETAVFDHHPMGDVAAAPLGSNLALTLQTSAAMLVQIKDRAITEGLMKPGEKLTPAIVKETLKHMDLKSIGKQMGLAGFFTLDALIFQFLVRPQIQQGHYYALASWMTLNAPILFQYYRKTALSEATKIKGAVVQMDMDRMNQVYGEVMQNNSLTTIQKNVFRDTFKSIENMRNGHLVINGKDQSGALSLNLKRLRRQFENDPKFKTSVEKTLDTMSAGDINDLFKIAKISMNIKGSVTAKEKRLAIFKFVAGLTALAATSFVLDGAVDQLTHALHYVSPATAGFFVSSFVATLGEYFTALKYFKEHDDNGATRNAADSSAANIFIAKMALGTSLFLRFIGQ